MRTKKCGAFAALAAVLLITAALITSCVDPIDLGGFTVPQGKEQTPFVPPEGNTVSQPPEGVTVSQPSEGNTVLQFLEEDADFEPPEEVGYLQLNISVPGSGARTIMPNTSAIDELDDFTNFDIYILEDDGATVVGTPKTGIALASVSTPILLSAGDYKVRVFGNLSGTAVATGISETVTITASAGDTASITLGEIVGNPIAGTTSHGTGTFTWNLSNASAAVTSAIMTVTPLSVGTTTPTIGELIGTPGNLVNSTGVALTSGYYRVSIALTKSGTKAETQMSVLHIYQGLTSNYVADLKTLKPNRYTVTFYYNDGFTDTPTPPAEYGTPLTNILHGATIPVASKPTDPTNREHGTWIFGEWYTDDTTQDETTAFTFGAAGTGTVIIRDTSLYAKWTDPATLGVTVTVANDVEWAANGSPELSASVTSWDRNTTVKIAITVDNRENFSSFTWYIDDDVVTPVVSGDDGEIFTFDFSTDVAYQIVGKYTIYVEATDLASKVWSSDLEIEVTD